MKETILQSKIIVARSGYSTIMDMAVLEKKCVLVPTPGQTEQEYLAKKLMQENSVHSQNQKDFDLLTALNEAEKTNGLKINIDTKNLEARINAL